ncbi:MAG: hypothetical protein K0S19_927, partial [Geminicoccaceae bacterium]|nr:hypothetical protein [Geminicoccaceae bacterium]
MHRWNRMWSIRNLGWRMVVGLCSLAPGLPALAQEPVAAPDTTVSDTGRVRELPELNVTVTRSAEPLQRVPYAVSVLNRGDFQRAQQT